MSGKDKNFTGSIPDIYDDFLVPLIFESYAQDMAQKVASAAPKTVLETAAGSGVVTRALAPLLASDARYVVTDLNPPMLVRAGRQQPANDRIEWLLADAMALPLDDDTFDVVCCQFGMMFLPDKTVGYREALRVLREDGRFIFNVWDRIEDNEFAQSVTATAAGFFPDDPPVFCHEPHMDTMIQMLSVSTYKMPGSGMSMCTRSLRKAAPTARIYPPWLTARALP